MRGVVLATQPQRATFVKAVLCLTIGVRSRDLPRSARHVGDPTVVLSGLFKEETSIGRKQTPGLGDPAAGQLRQGQGHYVRAERGDVPLKRTVMKDKRLYATGQARNANAGTAYGTARGSCLGPRS